ncbi:hypothetical protein AWENTII_004518 [Aspergillus wentii]
MDLQTNTREVNPSRIRPGTVGVLQLQLIQGYDQEYLQASGILCRYDKHPSHSSILQRQFSFIFRLRHRQPRLHFRTPSRKRTDRPHRRISSASSSFCPHVN